MNEAFLNINTVPTHVFTWGATLNEENFSKKKLVLCITGNPGLPGFYTKFLSAIHKKLGEDVPVWVIGHAGHDEPKGNDAVRVPALKGNEFLYGLDAQVRHKIEFIRNYIPADVTIHLIGHSIGAWMTLELLKIPAIKSRITKCYLLFPTVEYMAVSPNGHLYRNWLQRLWPIIYWLAVLMSHLPTIIPVCLVYLYFFVFSIPNQLIGTTLKYIRPTILSKIVFLADEEMERVQAPDYEHIKENVKLLKFYYGSTDGWTPVDHFRRLIENVPGVDAQVDIHEIAHAFVLRSSVEMGNIVAGWIQEQA